MIHENVYSLPALLVVALGVAGYWLVNYLQYRKYLTKTGAWPPLVPYHLPYGIDMIIGNLHYHFKHEPFGWINQHFIDTKSDTFQVCVLGQIVYMTKDPENIKAMLATQFNDFGKGRLFHEQWDFFLGNGIFNVDGQVWVDSRALLRPQFHRQRVSDLHVFEEHVSKMIELLPKDGRTVDMLPWFYRLTLDASTDYLFGQSIDSLTNPKTSFAEAFVKIQEIQSIRGKIGPLWRIYYPKEFKDSMKILNQFVEPFAERALSLSPEDIAAKEELQHEKINLTESLSRFTKSRTVLRDQLVSTLLASRDTTACALSWLFYELSYHPEIYAKLRGEVLNVLGTDGKPTYEDLKSMKYLQYCLNEVLRLYPPVPNNVRAALVDTSLPRGGGPRGEDPIFVPKETMVGYSTFLMHRRKDLFGDDVEDFNPSRWATWTPAAWTYIPFNGGPRICLGQNFALTEMAYVVSRTCQMFERIEERSGLKRGQVGFRADIILSPLNGVQIGLIPANLEK